MESGKIFYLIGKSCAGKDTIYKNLMEQQSFHTMVLYTTRPMRDGEVEGREYHFVTEKEMQELEREDRVIERRSYNTVQGLWHYFTVDDGQLDTQKGHYLLLGTLESYKKMREYYGEENVVTLYIEVEDGMRLERALCRERQQKKPNYTELCRRYLADEEDFSDENLLACGIEKRYQNNKLEDCLKELILDIEEYR